MGLVYSEMDDPKRAIEHHEQALAISRDMDDLLSEAMQLGNLGLLHHELGDRDEACRLLKQALGVFESIDVPNEVEKARSTLRKLGCDDEGGSRTKDAPTG